MKISCNDTEARAILESIKDHVYLHPQAHPRKDQVLKIAMSRTSTKYLPPRMVRQRILNTYTLLRLFGFIGEIQTTNPLLPQTPQTSPTTKLIPPTFVSLTKKGEDVYKKLWGKKNA